MNKTVLRGIYECFMLGMACVSISLFWLDVGVYSRLVVWCVWGVFVIDVGIRFYLSDKKMSYLIKHPFDIISLIPADSTFLLSRFVRLFQLFQFKTILGRYSTFMKRVLEELTAVSFLVLFMCANVLFYLVSYKVHSFGIVDSIIWYVKTLFLFNYVEGVESVTTVLVVLLIKIVGILSVGYVMTKLWGLFLRSWKIYLNRRSK